MNLYLNVLLLLLALSSAARAGTEPHVSHRVACQTTKGPLQLDIWREWAPRGADRFVELVRDGFFSDVAFFRCVRGFLTQFGISDNPAKKHWHRANIRDDPNLHKGVKKGYLSFAGGGPHTRSTQMFIAFEDLDFLGKEPWETPFGQVVEGMDTLDKLFKGYGDIPPFGKGPDQQKIHNRGNAYLHTSFPLLDYIKNCSVTFEDREYLDAQPPLPDPEEERRREEEEEAAKEKRREEQEERRIEEEGRKDEEREGEGSEGAPSDLHSAAAIGDLERVRGLLEGERQRHDIDMELLQRKDDNGWQALHEAVRGGHLEVVQYLVDHGADIGSETANGGTPLWWARRTLKEGHEVIAYLEQIGAPEGDPDL